MSKQSKNITSLDFDIFFKTTITTYYPDGAITPLDMKRKQILSASHKRLQIQLRPTIQFLQ